MKPMLAASARLSTADFPESYRMARLDTARRTANRPGSQRMARHKITDFLQSASAGRHAADGDRPRSVLCRTANRPGSQRVVWPEDAELFQNGSVGPRAADGDRPRSALRRTANRPRFAAGSLARRRGAFPERLGPPTCRGRGPSAVRGQYRDAPLHGLHSQPPLFSLV